MTTTQTNPERAATSTETRAASRRGRRAPNPETAATTNETAAETPEAQPPRPKRALGIFAHPDDAEFLCGGTVARLCARGWEVRYIIATSGDKGTKDSTLTPSRLAEMREAEQTAAGEVLGVKECIYLRYPDGFVQPDDELRGRLVRLIRRYRPDTVITWDGFRRGFNHRDHRAVGIATYDALFPAVRDPFYYPDDVGDGLDYHRVGEILLAGTDQPDWFVDVSDFTETKARAIYCHTSQIEAAPWDEFYKKYRERMEEGGRTSGVPFTEAFRRVTMRT